ncbi:MAG: precorrin-3B C(17)-methyltransferase [Spirochaetota bacterium]
MEQRDRGGGPGTLRLVGIGPGGTAHRTPAAEQAIRSCSVVALYSGYRRLLADLLEGKEVIATGMRGEGERVSSALDRLAAGRDVAILSRGDAGVYGMAGLALEMLRKRGMMPRVLIVPGITAANAAAGALGAPLMCDYAVLSLSDLLVPWERIRERLELVARADLVAVMYNPRSRSRTVYIEQARDIFLSCRAPGTPVGIVREAGTQDQEITLSDLGSFTQHTIDMSSVVIIGNTRTLTFGPWMFTPRGYEL